MGLSKKERIIRTFRGETVDRPPVKLWGADYGHSLLHPAYRPVYETALARTDLFGQASSPFDFVAGSAADSYEVSTRPYSEDWYEKETILRTPAGPLSSIELCSTRKKPGYTKTHFIKEPADLARLLSLNYEPYPVSLAGYFTKSRQLGDQGVAMFGIDHPGYAMQRLMGSELLAYLSVDERDLLRELIGIFAGRLRDHVQQVLLEAQKGLTKADTFIISFVGPELLIPPLLSFADFEEFCFQVDKPLLDDIHAAGGRVWIHSHGKVRHLLERFIAMGCDVLNPIEPPPMGDITLAEAFKITAGRMALEGNIEIHEIMEADEERLRQLIEDAVRTGAAQGRFILCPSAGFMEVPEPSPVMIRNLLTYIDFGLECAGRFGY